jgi:ribulose-5-phosphate 4-epimerase/fuculose-1-phosphate aldolase
MEYEKYFEEFITAARRVAEHNLVLCGSGNLSWRVDDSNMLITATSSWMGNLSEDQIAVCSIADCAPLNGAKPSKEIGFHAGILRERREVNVVLHFQSPCATTIACRQPQIENYYVIPEAAYYIGPVSVAPYLTPGSPELAEAVTAAIREHDMAILRNHGQVTVGKNFDEAIEKAVYFELACKIILQAGDDVQHISGEAVEELLRMREASQTTP